MNDMEALKEGVWLDFPQNKPEDGELVLIFIKGNWGGRIALATYNEEYACWDDADGDDYLCDEADKFMKIPNIA